MIELNKARMHLFLSTTQTCYRHMAICGMNEWQLTTWPLLVFAVILIGTFTLRFVAILHYRILRYV